MQMPVIFRATMVVLYSVIGVFFSWRYVFSNVNQVFDVFAAFACFILAWMTARKKIFPLNFAGAILTLACLFSAVGLYSGYDESGLSDQKKHVWMLTIVVVDIVYLYVLWKYKSLLAVDISSDTGRT